MTEQTAAWADATTFDPTVTLEPTAVVVRQPERTAPARSDLAELAAVATQMGGRDPAMMLKEARRVGALLGARAEYSFPAGGGRVSGPTIDLMDALAIVWGRTAQEIQVLEETRDRVVLRGRVVDLLALTVTSREYVSAIAPAPGKFANKPDQVDRWRVMQIQSAASKAIRGALEHALPAWLVDAALEAAREAVAAYGTGGLGLAEARQAAGRALWEGHGLDRATLEAWIGAPVDLWAGAELARLRTLLGQLRSGQTSPEAVRLEAGAAAPAPTAAPPDKLGSLGLRSPSPPSAASVGGTPSPRTGGDPLPSPAPSSAASAADPAAGAAPAKRDPAKDAAIAEIETIRRQHPQEVAAAFAAATPQVLRAADLGRRKTESVQALLADIRARVAPAAPTEAPEPAAPQQLDALAEALTRHGLEAVRPLAERVGLDLDADVEPTCQQVGDLLQLVAQLERGERA